MGNRLKKFLKRQPVKTWIWLLVLWAIFEAFCVFLRGPLDKADVPLKFPFSVCIIESHFKYWPALVVFLAAAWLALKRLPRIKTFELWAIGLILIISGNLIQGFDGAFVEPLGMKTEFMDQYYMEAAAIKTTPSQWLADFNERQGELMTHTKTHPPFAVLLFHPFVPEKPASIAMTVLPTTLFWISAVGLCVPLLFSILVNAGIGKNRSAMISLFLAVMPAFNIYSLVCLDSMVFFLSLIFFWGLVDLQKNRLTLLNVSALAISLVLINMLTFAGLFFIATVFLLAISDLLLLKNGKILFACIVAAVTLAVVVAVLKNCGYDHVRAFLTASKLENKDGMMLLADPLVCVQSRLEDVCEIILCLGLVGFVMLITPRVRKIDVFASADRLNIAAVCGIGVLLAMFLAGAYRTGETARACMFIYPFIFLLMRKMSLRVWREIFICGALQTAAMQLLATYDW